MAKIEIDIKRGMGKIFCSPDKPTIVKLEVLTGPFQFLEQEAEVETKKVQPK